MSARFRLALTADGYAGDGQPVFGDIGLGRLAAAGVDWQVLPHLDDSVPAGALDGFDGVLSFGHLHVGADVLAAHPRLRLVARFGAGYETVDVAACTAAGVAVTNTPLGIRTPLATAGLTLLLALSHHVAAKDRLVREGRWADRHQFHGTGLHGKTLGILGFGGVGAELARLAAPLGMRVIGCTRSGISRAADELGVALVGAADVARESDFVVLCAALTDSSRHMVDAAFLRSMKPSAYLINIGRGGLVDQDALVDALRDGWIAGAGLDVFEPEPIAADDPLLALDNVLVSPHSLCWTEDFIEDVSREALDAVIDVAAGVRPRHLVNPAVWRDAVALA